MPTSVNEILSSKKVCVLIPTYNNAKTLERVLGEVRHYTTDILVVNDGSSDETADILAKYTDIEVLTFDKNRGKGKALRQGFEKALAMGYKYALTIDSDGQHFAHDIPVFARELQKSETPVLLIGSRDMTHKDVPKKSSFGHKFSNFWFWFETGVKLTDTQSGYRLYPLEKLSKNYVTNRFEFEVEVIVRASWSGIEVKNVPIEVLYDKNERVSHFRPFQDFTRVSILNTILVLIAIFYIKPRDFFRKLKKKSLWKFIKEDILEHNASAEVKSLSVALGIFCGIAPFWGFQTLITLSVAVLCRLNKAIAFACSNISIPPMIPIIILASLRIGSIFVKGDILPKSGEITMEYVKNNLLQYLIGSIILALSSATLLGGITYIILKRKSTHNKK